MEPEFASEDFFLALWVVVVDISQVPGTLRAQTLKKYNFA